MKEKIEMPEEYIKKGRALAWLSYFGLLLIIPAVIQKDNPYTVYHVKQGMGLLIVNVIVLFICISISTNTIICQIISAVLLVINVVGIFNAILGKVRPLPLIGFIGELLNF